MKLTKIILEQEDMFVPRRVEQRQEYLKQIHLKQIRAYVDQGSEGELDLSNSPLTSLPKWLTEADFLEISNSKIETLPENFKVHNIMYANHSNLRELPKNFSSDVVFLSFSQNLTKLPDNLVINGSLYLTECKNLKTLPSGLVVKGYLSIEGTGIEELPEDLQAARVYTFDSPFYHKSDPSSWPKGVKHVTGIPLS